MLPRSGARDLIYIKRLGRLRLKVAVGFRMTESAVLEWISETLFHIFSWIPNWLYADDSPRYLIVRSLLGLGLIVLVIMAVAIWRARRSHRQNQTQGRD
jgi:F0F1-type ATP synthase assembly protein I